MANVISHYEVAIAPSGSRLGVMAKVFWGENALQTVTIARHFPRDPQQAIGYRGIVDYTSGRQTTDVTLDCILTEDTEHAVRGTGPTGTSIYRFAELTMTLGVESYVLTSCNVGFTQGAPATVSYGWITAGAGSALIESASPAVLTEGEEAAFAVVMGDDGSGISLAPSGVALIPSGVQSLNFTSTINKDNIMDIRSSQPIQFITTYPVDITAAIELFDKDIYDMALLKAIAVNLAGLSNHNADKIGGPYPDETFMLVAADGLTRTEETEALNVGGYVTYTYNYNVADLAIPMTFRG